MARIAGVNLPTQKRLEIGLTYIYGIGRSTAQKVVRELELDPDQKVRDLTDEEVTKLRNYIDSELEVEGDLRRERAQAIKRLTEIGSYRGIRHRRGLPVRGQQVGRVGVFHAHARGPRFQAPAMIDETVVREREEEGAEFRARLVAQAVHDHAAPHFLEEIVRGFGVA